MMQAFVLLFIALVGVGIVISMVVFAFVSFNVARFGGKVFRHAQRELDRQAAESEPEERVPCPYCGSKTASAEKCSNCGAPRS